MIVVAETGAKVGKERPVALQIVIWHYSACWWLILQCSTNSASPKAHFLALRGLFSMAGIGVLKASRYLEPTAQNGPKREENSPFCRGKEVGRPVVKTRDRTGFTCQGRHVVWPGPPITQIGFTKGCRRSSKDLGSSRLKSASNVKEGEEPRPVKNVSSENALNYSSFGEKSIYT